MKNKIVAALLAFFVGFIGVHKFYLNRPVQGVLYFLLSWTGIPAIIAFIDFIVLLVMSQHDFDYKYNYDSAGGALVREKQALYREKIQLERLHLQEERKKAEQRLNNKKIEVKKITGEQADTLAAWQELLEKGIIDQYEFEEKKRVILGRDD
ncbi:NINE protein [Saprospira sp. CCB-QB6]|nr:NINE protein [Saprospira sp. CCB-QB6]WCL82777.1 NINE protein [Saprospira sp. CCB-QB6]